MVRRNGVTLLSLVAEVLSPVATVLSLVAAVWATLVVSTIVAMTPDTTVAARIQ
jgi:hypothetical protein